MSSHFGSCSSFLPPAPNPALSASLQFPSPFILSTEFPYNISLSCDTRWPGSQVPSFVQSYPNLTDTMPSIPAQREAQAQLPFQTADLSLSLLANASGLVFDHQPHDSLFPHSQQPPFPNNDFEADPKEKQRPRPSNAFILFRSDFLKRKLVSKGQETRQHKLSIIAAKCWNKLTREEKKKWFLEAEREKKAHALKYADHQPQPRARARTRRESRIMASPRELEHLGRLADMAYQEIINDTPSSSQLSRESATSLSASTTTALASGSPTPPTQVKGTDLSALDCYQEQEQPSQQPLFSSPAGKVGELSLPQSYQPLRTASASDFSTFQDGGMFPTTSFVGTYPATISRPASAPMCPTASSVSGTLTTFPSELAFRGSTSINEQTSNYFTMFSDSLPHDITLSGFSGLANA
ncbi:hypothetical protein DFH94DRAFT_688881 [Russula ochroleuca]|uniref:HMG box domain-containing protein n=1 Tax=Russula ochroleuca TaxID=152965 RepID=A0A9P5N1R3_9AGAM|nr:hypothetical protein DFH94DRAFT_688881 [Russula ochroleuca]